MVSPMVSSVTLAVGIDSCSNVIAQFIRAWRRDEAFGFDALLFARFVLYACIMEPVNYYWLALLEKLWPSWTVAKRAGPQTPLASLGSQGEDIEPEDQNGRAEDGDAEADDLAAQHAADDDDYNDGQEAVLVRNWRNILLRWVADAWTFGALFNIVAFLLLMGVFKGKTLYEISLDLKNELFTMILNSYKVWPIGGFINMAFIPAERRIVFYSFCGLVWNIYLSLVAARL